MTAPSGAGPSISILIPTLRRADTLRSALQTALDQTYPDVEIVVQNNTGDAAVRALVESIGDPRLRHHSTDELLPMADNWEAGLANCSGEILTIIGDDDGLLPDACSIAAQAIGRDGIELLTWQNCMYYWPTYFDPELRNRLSTTVELPFALERRSSRRALEAFFRFELHFSGLPMVYNSFVSRSLVERVVSAHGRYILGGMPDVGTGIVNVASTESFLRSTRPLSVFGLSHHGTGHVHGGTKSGWVAEIIRRDFPIVFAELESGHPWNLQLLIASELELFRERGIVDPELRVDQHGLLRAMASSINEDPNNYDANARLIERLAGELGVAPGRIVIPAPMSVQPPVGVYPRGPGETHHEIDGDSAGLANVADAVALLSRLVPTAGEMTWAPELPALGRLGRAPLSFARGGEGVGSLERGWSTPEEWGTWSVADEAAVRLELSEPWSPELRIAVGYRILPALDGTPRKVECRLAGKAIGRWDLGADRHRGEILIDPGPLEPPETLELTFANLDPRSPAELGLGFDSRYLGIGLEQARVADDRTSG